MSIKRLAQKNSGTNPAVPQCHLAGTAQQRRTLQVRHLYEARPQKRPGHRSDQATKAYEDEVKRQFIEEPANMKLLVVVSKLLTGFDAPSCTYIYLDNELYDHNLFQAICRTNRLDGDDKDYGHIVDFKKLFDDVQEAIAVYNSDELDIDEGSGGTNNVELKDWLKEG